MTDQTFHRAPSGDADCDAPVPQAYEPHAAQGDPLPFAAPSLRRSLTDVFDEEEQADVTQDFAGYEQEDDEALADEAAPQLTIVEAGCEPDVDDRPVDELGLVQLAARLGSSIEKRRAWLAGRQTSVPPAIPPLAPFGDAEDFEAAAPEDAARGIADFFGPAGSVEQHDVTPSFAAPVEQPESDAAPAVVPQALRGMPTDHYDDEDEDALAASFSLPLEGIHSEPDDPFDAEDDQFDEQEPDDGEYSSLLAMKNPFARQQEFVRVEEPEDESRSIEPAVTFPSSSPAAVEDEAEDRLQAPASRPFDPPKNPAESALRSALPAAPRDPGDAERSLRDALATLQRMSGAA